MTALRLPERDAEHEDALAFTLTSPVDLAALGAEIKAAHGWRKNLGLATEGDPTGASEDNPAVLWVLRADANPNTVRSAVSAAQEVEAQEPSDEDVSADLTEKAGDGKDFTASEIQQALRLLLIERQQ